MRKYFLSYISCLLMMLVGVTACSSDGDAPDEGGSSAGKTCTLHFTISPAPGGGNGTRANLPTPSGWDNGSVDENMKSWVVAFVDQSSGKVEALVEKNLATPVTQDEVVVSGLKANESYVVYSFANISSTELGLSKGVNAAAIDFATLEYAINGNDFDVNAKGIPMSNYQDIKISDDGKKALDAGGTNEVTQLWTVRMLSKVTVKFKNITNQAITVNKITISDITDNPQGNAKNIMLLPSTIVNDGKTAQKIYYSESSGWKHLPDNVSKSSFTHQIMTGVGENQKNGITIAANTSDYDSSDDGANSVSFYVNESIADKEFPYFVVTLETNVCTERYFMYTGWNQIARNDHHVLKIALSDYKLRLKVEGYSAIGMEPSLEDDGKQLNLTFHMPDDEFHIIPVVTKYGDASNTPVTFTNLKWENISESETDAEDIVFSSKPVLVAGQNRIEGVMLGELGQKTGPIIYQLSCKVNDGTADAPTLVYRVAISQDLEWYTSAARRYGSRTASTRKAISGLLNNYERKFYRYE